MSRELSTPTVAAFVQSVVAFAVLACAYSRSPIEDVDVWLANALHATAGPHATAAFAAVSMLGSTPVLAVAAGTAGGFLLGRGHRHNAALVVVAFVGAAFLTWILKATFERPRPHFDEPVATFGWFSFPSGHAASSIALYGAIAYAFGVTFRSPRARVAMLGFLALVVAAIGLSRLYLGAHYLSDVVAGYSVGLAWLLLTVRAFRAPTPLRGAKAPAARTGDVSRPDARAA